MISYRWKLNFSVQLYRYHLTDQRKLQRTIGGCLATTDFLLLNRRGYGDWIAFRLNMDSNEFNRHDL